MIKIRFFDLYDSIYMCDMYILQMEFGNYFAEVILTPDKPIPHTTK